MSLAKSLIEAVKENDVCLVKNLLQQGAPVNCVDECGYSPLHWSALYDRPEAAHTLLTNGTERCFIDAEDRDGYTPLHLGIKHGHKDVTQLLVTYGADINAKTQTGRSALELATLQGRPEIIQILQSVQEKKENSVIHLPKKWKCGKLLGCGAFGRVFLGCDLNNNREIAIKRVDTNGRKISVNRELTALDAEIKVLKNLSHERIVQYYGMEKKNSSMYIFMEYMPGGSMQEYVSVHGSLSEDRVRLYTRQILEGVAYLHANMVVHRDIKGANILLTSDCNSIKLGDFGLSKRLQRCSTISGLKTTLGSPYWMAPEVVKASPYKGEGYGRKADICVPLANSLLKSPLTGLEISSDIHSDKFNLLTNPLCTKRNSGDNLP